MGVTDDSKLGSLVPTGFFKGNTFRAKNGADSPRDKGTWGLGVGLGWGQPLWAMGLGDQPFRFWGLGQGDLGFRGGTWLGTTLMRFGGQPFRFWGLGQGDLGFRGGTWLGTTLMRFGGQPFRFWGLGQGDLGFRDGTWLGTTLMRFGDSSLGFGGWDKVTFSAAFFTCFSRQLFSAVFLAPPTSHHQFRSISHEMKASKRKKNIHQALQHCISPIFGVTSDLTLEVQATPRPS